MSGASISALDRHIGARLRARRQFLRMPPDWLAGHMQITLDALDAYEAGRVRIPASHLADLADVLDVATRYFTLGYESGGEAPAEQRSSWLREVDRWFAAQIFPYERDLLVLARRLVGNEETARDIVQEAYAEILCGERWRVLIHPRAYALKVVRSTALRWLARTRVVAVDFHADLDEVAVPDPATDAEALMSAKQKRQLLLDAIERLPPQCRRVVKLRRLREMAPREIAKHLGISVSAVEKHLARGMVLIADDVSSRERGPMAGKTRDNTETV